VSDKKDQKGHGGSNMAKNNVINLDERRNSAKNSSKIKDSAEAFRQKYSSVEMVETEKTAAEEIIDMTERRQKMLDSERRSVTRTVLSQFIGVCVVLPDKGLQPVVLYDVSEGGVAFDLPLEMGGFNLGETVTLRIYLSHDTYFSFSTKVVNRRQAENEGVMRHGAAFRKTDISFKTLFYFTKFLENVSLIARKDNGDRVMGKVE
jgi:hypothetical protein